MTSPATPPVTPFRWNDRTVRKALGLRVEAADPELEYAGVSTDSRSIAEGDLFVALVGRDFDGHDFVADAAAAGGRGAVVARPVSGADGATLYPVDDTLVALGRLASFRRRALPARIVGITGSSGKTGTKDLTAGALRGSLEVHATRGNLNNRIGLPLTLLSAPVDADVVVAEMGTNEPGEIATLAAIAEPDVAVVTTVGESHLEKLGSVEGVLDEKLDLVRALGDRGVAIVGDTPDELPEAARKLATSVRVAGFGPNADPDLRPGDLEVDLWGHHTFRWKGRDVTLQMPGRHAVSNALLALAVAEELGVSAERAAEGVSAVHPGAMRGEVRHLGELSLILDCYNANPQSVRAALDLLEEQGTGAGRVAVLGTMLELGEESEVLHRAGLRDALGRALDIVVATGAFADAAPQQDEKDAEPATGRHRDGPLLIVASDPADGYDALRPHLTGSETVLLKASRGVALESLLPRFAEDFAVREGAR